MSPDERQHQIIAGFIEHMIEAVASIEAFTHDVEVAKFVADEQKVAAVAYMFIKLGEAASRVPEGFRDDHPEIPWPDIRQYRNFLTHAYEYVDAARVLQVVRDDIPGLADELPKLLRSIDPDAATP